MYQFSATAPEEFLALPKFQAKDNDFALVIDDICRFASMTSIERNEGMSETEYAAKLLDAYAESPDGRSNLSTIGDMAYRISSNFSAAMSILTESIAPSIEKIINTMNQASDKYLEKKFGYVGKNGNYTNKAPKFFLLDVDHLYASYETTAAEFANTLCSRYHYNVEYLNDANVAGLIRRITPVTRLDVSRDTINAIMEDVVVQISSNTDGEVTINTNDQDAVKVEGATPNIVKEDDQSSRSTDDEGDTADTSTSEEPDTSADANPVSDEGNTEDTVTENESENSNANVSVETGNDNAEITITVNGEKVTTSEEDKQLALKIVRACFDPIVFDTLRKDLFTEKGRVRHTNLLNALKFIKKDIRELILPVAEEKLPPLEVEMLMENLEQVRELQMAGVVWLDINSVQFTDTIIIGPNLLNKNLINRAMRDGVQNVVPLIRNYLRAYHNDNRDDLYYDYVHHKDIGQGVSYKTLLSSTYEVEQVLSNAKSATQASYENLIRDAQVRAFHDASIDYVKKLAETSTEEELGTTGNDKNEFLQYCYTQINKFCQELKTNPNANAEDMLYRLVVNRWYKNTLVESIYTHLNEGIKAEASLSNGSIGQDQMAMIKAKTVASLAAEYIFAHFIR